MVGAKRQPTSVRQNNCPYLTFVLPPLSENSGYVAELNLSSQTTKAINFTWITLVLLQSHPSYNRLALKITSKHTLRFPVLDTICCGMLSTHEWPD